MEPPLEPVHHCKHTQWHVGLTKLMVAIAVNSTPKDSSAFHNLVRLVP